MYAQRAKIIKKYCSPKVSKLQEEIFLFECAIIMNTALKNLMIGLPSFEDIGTCYNSSCIFRSDIDQYFSISILCNRETICNLEEKVRDVLENTEEIPMDISTADCHRNRCIKRICNKSHLFIEILPLLNNKGRKLSQIHAWRTSHA